MIMSPMPSEERERKGRGRKRDGNLMDIYS
jgi:hypothetical protein